jgi:transcriptional regulator with XRE-family HTH domain
MRRIKPIAADQLREWMKRSGREKADVAASFGVTEQHVRHLLTGSRTPSLTLALRVAEVTGIPVSQWAKYDEIEGVPV